MGYYKQYDDLFTYTLEEIVIAHGEQGKGYGSALMRELEARVKQKGAGAIELLAVDDEAHERFYGRLGFGNPRGIIPKSKWYV